MSGFSDSMPPRSRPAPERPPVETWVMMPGQCLRMPSSTCGEALWRRRRRLVVVAHVQVHERGTRLEGLLRRLDLLGHLTGTAGLSFLRGSEPVIATVMMQGAAMVPPRRASGDR